MRPSDQELRQKLASGGEGLTLLLIRLGAMGDIVRTVPALRILRSALPGATIHWVLDPPWVQLLHGDRDLASCLPFPRQELQNAHLRTLRKLRSDLRALRSDITLDFHGNLRSGVVGLLSGAPMRLGYAGHQQKEGNRWMTTQRVASGPRRTPRIRRNLDLLSLLGIQPPSEIPALDGDLPLFAVGRAEAAALVGSSRRLQGRFAVISPGASASQAYKRPPATILAASADRAAKAGIEPLVVWGPGERLEAEAVCREAGHPEWLAPATSLPALAALIRSAALFVGGDSGPMHLACAAGTSVVAIYGPTDPVVNAPWAVSSEIVASPDARYRGIKRHDRANGFAGVDVPAAVAAVERLLQKSVH